MTARAEPEAVKRAGGANIRAGSGNCRPRRMPRAGLSIPAAWIFVLSPEAIAAELLSLARHPVPSAAPRSLDRERPGPVSGSRRFPAQALNRVFGVAECRQSSRLQSLPPQQRQPPRGKRLMELRCCWINLDDYVKVLEENAAELDALYDELLIEVTGFFRDREASRALQSTVFPALIRGSPDSGGQDSLIRIWVPACATGEEAWSVAIELLE